MGKNIATYGLVGYPIEHSLSPRMHNAAFKALNISATYELFPLQEHELSDFFKSLREKTSPVFGLNVTVPYKEKAMTYMDSLSPFAQKVGAINTVIILKDRHLVGYNTDGPGFLSHLAELGFETAKKCIAVIGAGGASRAIISALCMVPERPEIIGVYDIDADKPQTLVSDLKKRIDVSIVSIVNSIDDLEIKTADLLINATPIGMKAGDPLLIEPGMFHSKLLVYDLIYNPAKTQLLHMAEAQGARISNGLGMLFYQGVLAFQHWADMQLSEDIKGIMRKSLEQGEGV